MDAAVGIAFAFTTFMMWTLGDFFIQRSSRQIGIWKSLFAIALFGAIVPLPFVWHVLPSIWETSSGLILLATLGSVVIFAALFEFEALKRGKLSIVEPVFGLEIPITLGLAVALGFDHITTLQSTLILLISVGVILVAFEGKKSRSKRHVLEKGIVLAGIGATAMALTNFLVGVGSREIDPLATIWFVNAFTATLTLSFLLATRQRGFMRDIRRFWPSILGEAVFDNLAWFSFAFSMTLIPISVSTAIAESYIVLTVLIGIVVNRERLLHTQKWGVLLTVTSLIILCLTLTT